jgi:hypothetical protein
MPYFSGVSDLRRRSIEFMLDLHVGKLESERAPARSRGRDQDAWRSAVRTFKDRLLGHGLVTVRLLESLTVAWPPEQPPVVAEIRGSKWIGLDNLLAELRAEQTKLEAEEVPRVRAAAAETEERLSAPCRKPTACVKPARSCARTCCGTATSSAR